MTVLAVKLSELASVIWVSLAAGVVVSAAFSLVVLESGRAAEARRTGRAGAANVHTALAGVFFVAFVVIVAYGVAIMLSKD